MLKVLSSYSVLDHVWYLRDDGKYECGRCKEVATAHTVSVLKRLCETQSVRPCKHNEKKYLHSKKENEEKPKQSEVLVSQKIKELFKNKDVVTFDELEPLMPEDVEQFWTGIDTDQEGMLDFLANNNWELYSCRKKNSEYPSEIYVNFREFELNNIPHPEPTVEISNHIEDKKTKQFLKEKAVEIANQTGRGHCYIGVYQHDGYVMNFSGTLKLDYKSVKKKALEIIEKELGIKIVRE